MPPRQSGAIPPTCSHHPTPGSLADHQQYLLPASATYWPCAIVPEYASCASTKKSKGRRRSGRVACVSRGRPARGPTPVRCAQPVATPLESPGPGSNTTLVQATCGVRATGNCTWEALLWYRVAPLDAMCPQRWREETLGLRNCCLRTTFKPCKAWGTTKAPMTWQVGRQKGLENEAHRHRPQTSMPSIRSIQTFNTDRGPLRIGWCCNGPSG